MTPVPRPFPQKRHELSTFTVGCYSIASFLNSNRIFLKLKRTTIVQPARRWSTTTVQMTATTTRKKTKKMTMMTTLTPLVDSFVRNKSPSTKWLCYRISEVDHLCRPGRLSSPNPLLAIVQAAKVGCHAFLMRFIKKIILTTFNCRVQNQARVQKTVTTTRQI